MHRNGKTQHHTGDTLTLLETPAELQGTLTKTQGMSTEAQGTLTKTQGMPTEAQGTLTKTQGMPTEAQGTATKTQGVSAELQGTTAETQGVSAELQGTTAEAQGTTTVAQGTRSRQQGTLFGVNASIAKRLASAQLAIDAVLTDYNLQITLDAYGYGVVRMAEGKALRDQALALQQQQRQRYGDQARAGDALASAQTHAHLTYTQHRSVARVALRADRGAAQMLGLDTPLPAAQANWLIQAQQFYANALADAEILGALAGYKLTDVQLAAGGAQIAAVATANVARQAARSAAQASTQARDTALQALNRWMRDFLAIARVALADQPQRLAQLGVTRG